MALITGLHCRASYLGNQQYRHRNTPPHLNPFEKEQPAAGEEVRKEAGLLDMEAALVHDGLLLLSEAAGSSAASRSTTAGARLACAVTAQMSGHYFSTGWPICFGKEIC